MKFWWIYGHKRLEYRKEISDKSWIWTLIHNPVYRTNCMCSNWIRSRPESGSKFPTQNYIYRYTHSSYTPKEAQNATHTISTSGITECKGIGEKYHYFVSWSAYGWAQQICNIQVSNSWLFLAKMKSSVVLVAFTFAYDNRPDTYN